jgi:1,4-alpha-glucan branching enzyme
MNSQNGDKGIEFSLFAPYNEDIALLGDWSNWERIEMERGDDGWWRVRVPLEDGEYQYKFLVKSKSWFAPGEMLKITDPRASRVTYDENENACLTVKDGKRIITTYEWQHDDVPLPPNEQLVIYEMHIGEFRGGPGDSQEGKTGTFQGAIEKLDYLAELGINAVELMPVTEFPGERSWGYNPRVLFSVENSYGTPDDFCRLVDECHARGIRVILDGVYNHGEIATPLAQIDYNYWYYGENPDLPEHQWGPKFNYEFHDDQLDVWPAREYIRDALQYWINEYHIDGIRFDATAIIKNYDVLHWMNSVVFDYVKGLKPFLTVAEHVPQDPTVTGVDGPMDAAWHETFSKQLQSTIVGADKDGRGAYDLNGLAAVLNPRSEGFGSPYNVVNYIDNHDQHRIMWQLGEHGFIDDPAFRRNKMGVALLVTAPGLPLLWMGQEFGESAPRQVNEWQPIDWALFQNERNADLHRYYCGLLGLRKSTPALSSDSVEVFHLDPERSILAYKRWNEGGNVAVVVVNLKDQFAGQVEIGNWPGDGAWHEHIFNYDIDVQGGVLRDDLAESGVKIYIKQ